MSLYTVQEIVIGSDAVPKVMAGKLACPKDIIVGHPAKSLVNRQPCGLSEIRQGACNRRKAARKGRPSGDIWIGIENGVVWQGGKWFDLAAVAGCNRAGREVLVWSLAIEIPTWVVTAVRRHGFDTTTIGLMYAGAVKGVDHQDIHAHLTNGALKREQILAQAIVVVRAQL